MTNENSNGLTKLERLAVLLRDDGLDPESMDPQQLDQYLKDWKVDMAGPTKRFDYMLKRAKAHQRLERARDRRLRAIERATRMIASGGEAVEAAQAKVHELLEKLKQRNPEQAMVYAREFEKATPEDYTVLKEDLMLLEMEDEEDATRDQ